MTKKQTNFLLSVVAACDVIGMLALAVALKINTLPNWGAVKVLMVIALGATSFAFGVSAAAWLDEKRRNEHIKRWNRILSDYDNF